MPDLTKEQRAEVLTELRRRTHDGDTVSELARALIYAAEAQAERWRFRACDPLYLPGPDPELFPWEVDGE